MKVKQLSNQQICIYGDRGELIAGINLGRYRPWIYPLCTPNGKNILREFPPDHGFHNGAFFGHYPLVVNGVDHNFWGAPPFRDREDEMRINVGLIQSSVNEITSCNEDTRILLNCRWISYRGEELLEERRSYECSSFAGCYRFKTGSVLKNISQASVLFQQTKFSGHAMRLSHFFCVANGALLLRENDELSIAEVHGKPISKKGVKLLAGQNLDKPNYIEFMESGKSNFFLRDYGLVALNPFFSQSVSIDFGDSFQFESEILLS